MRTSNPMMKESVFTQAIAGTETMTLQGAVNKTIALLALVVIGASYSWNLFYNQGAAAVQPWMIGGIIGSLVFAMITIFKATWAPKTAPIYAVLEGLALGGISAFFEARFPGIVIQAVGLTFGTLFALLLAYKTRLIRATENFKLGVFAATGGIAVVYLVSMVGGMFGWNMPVAALNLVLDFDFIERGHGVAPRYMEWYAAFGLVVTLAWLYLELLRLLSKLRER